MSPRALTQPFEQSPRLSLGTSNQAESSTASASRPLNKQITTKSAQKRPLKTAEDEPQVKKPRAAIINNSGAGPSRRSTAPISARHTPAENDPLRPLPAHNDTEARKQRQAAIEVEQKLRAAKLRVFQMERLKNLCDQFRTHAREPHGEEVMYQRKCIAENEMKLARYEVDRIKGNLQGKSEADARQLLDAIRSSKGLLLAFELHPACIDPAPSTLAREWVFRTTMPDGDSGQLRELKQLAAAEDRSTPKVCTARWLDGLPASVAGFEKHSPAATSRVETKPPNSNARAQPAGTCPQASASSNLSTRTQSRHRVPAARSRFVTDADDYDLEERLIQQEEEAAAYSMFVSEDRRERKRHNINMALLDFLMIDETEDGYYLENSRSESDVGYSSSW